MNEPAPAAGPDRSDAEADPATVLEGELVARDGAPALAAPRWARGVRLARARWVELSARPAVLATVSVGAGLAAGALRHALVRPGRGRSGAAQRVVVTGVILHRVDVVHHVLHHPLAARAVARTVDPAARRG